MEPKGRHKLSGRIPAYAKTPIGFAERRAPRDKWQAGIPLSLGKVPKTTSQQLPRSGISLILYKKYLFFIKP